MKNFVITSYYSDYECQADVVDCIQYESLEKLKMDLELFVEDCIDNKWLSSTKMFCNIELYIGRFICFNKSKRCYEYEEPLIQELDEWFLSKIEGS